MNRQTYAAKQRDFKNRIVIRMLNTAEDKTASADRFVVRSRAELLDRLSSAAADIIIMPQELSLDIANLMRDAAVHEKRMTVALKNVGRKSQQD